MKARAVVSIGVVLGGGLLMGVLNGACSSKEEPTAGGPSTSGAGTTAGTSSTGGGGAGNNGGTGGAAAGTAGTGMAQGGGLALVDGKCPPNSVKRMDMLCYCQPMTLSACADGCGDFMTDPDHCGNCTTKCTTQQACNAGKCSADPKVLVPAAAGSCDSIQIAVSGANLYFTNKMAGTVNSVPVAGGAVAPLATGQMAPTLLKVTADKLFWLASGAKSVMTAPLTGMNPTALVPAQATDIGGFTLSEDGMTLYFAAGKVVSKVPVAGGAAAEVGHEASGIARALAVSGTLIATPVDVNGDVDVMTIGATPAVCASENDVGETNANCARLARSQGSLNFDNIFIVGDNAYWANGLNISTSSAKMPSGFNDQVTSSTSPTANGLTAFTIVKNVVYFADDSGVVFSSPLTVNSTAATVARGQMAPTSIAADDANVYWANKDCSIVSLPLK